jgi:hypothetical protein
VVEFASQGPLNWLDLQQVVKLALKGSSRSEKLAKGVAIRIYAQLAVISYKPTEFICFADFYNALKKGKPIFIE